MNIMRKTVCMLCPSYCYGEHPPCESIGDGEGGISLPRIESHIEECIPTEWILHF
jgi:hypothetical protein